jgi:hypothetical protein
MFRTLLDLITVFFAKGAHGKLLDDYAKMKKRTETLYEFPSGEKLEIEWTAHRIPKNKKGWGKPIIIEKKKK